MRYIKLIILGLLISSLLGYLEWGESHARFLFQIEYELFFSGEGKADSIVHPIILLPCIGQLLLIIVLFQKQPNLKLVLVATILLSLLLLLICLVGVLANNLKMVLSTIPFLALALYFLVRFLKLRKAKLK